MSAIYRAKDRSLFGGFVGLNWFGVMCGWLVFFSQLPLSREGQLDTFWIYGAWLVPLLAGTLYAAVWTHVLASFVAIDQFLGVTTSSTSHWESELHTNGQKKAEGKVEFGKKSGPWIYWYANGQKEAEGNFLNGKREGSWTAWHANGQKWKEATLKDDKPEGPWTYWNEDGSIDPERSGIYKDGKRIAPLPKKK